MPDNPRDPRDQRTRAEKLAAMAAQPGPEGEVARALLPAARAKELRAETKRHAGFLAGQRAHSTARPVEVRFGSDGDIVLNVVFARARDFDDAIQDLAKRFRTAADNPEMREAFERMTRDTEK